MEIMEAYHRNWIENADPTMCTMTLFRSPFWVPILVFSYLYFTLGCGPRFMKDREPYSLKTFIRYYDIFQIVANAIMAYHGYNIILPWNAENLCKALQDVNLDQHQMMTTLVWYVLIVKLIDFIETGVFVLRKKHNQITFLHLYHHVGIVLFTWLTGRYFCSAFGALGISINSSVHVLMYTYYLITSFGTTWQKILRPMKPLLTALQMVQILFVIYVLIQTNIPGCYVTKSVINTAIEKERRLKATSSTRQTRCYYAQV
ncbi:hypothetical protein KM043_009721 [Ampulex compressa]|nr:hypothetical protein KM043_009721 [Ampulex compressa]